MKVVILAGGKATRLGDLVKDTKKAFLKVGNKTVMQYILENLGRITAPLIIQTIYDYNSRGSCGVLKDLEDQLSEPFIVINGDTITNANIQEMINLWQSNKSQAIIFNPQEDITHNGGTYIFSKSVLRKINNDFMDIQDLLKRLENYIPYQSEAYFYDIGTPERLQEARRIFQ